MDFYQSVWCDVHAVNTCSQLQLMFPKSQQECKDLPLNSLVSRKLDLTTVLVVLMTCCCGWKSQENNNVQRLVFIVANSTVEEKVNMDSTFMQYVMPTIILLMCLCSTQHLHQTICHFSHLLYINDYLMSSPNRVLFVW